MPNTLINVSNRLPVTVEEERVTKSSGGLVAALEGLPEGQYKTKWIGWPGAAFPEESRRQEIAQKLAEEHGCVPVFLSEEDSDDLNRVNHFFPNRGSNPPAIAVSLALQQVPICEQWVIKGDNIDVAEVSHVVATSKIRRSFRFTVSGSDFDSGDREPNP